MHTRTRERFSFPCPYPQQKMILMDTHVIDTQMLPDIGSEQKNLCPNWESNFDPSGCSR
jgi:hypothetical protein